MKVSLLLPCFSRAKVLDLGLWSISQQKINCDLEVLVLNDGIPDDTEKVCDKYMRKLNIRYIFTGQRNAYNKIIQVRPPAFALNIGIKQSKGEIIILSNPEIFHLNNSIDLTIEPLLYNSKLLTTPAVMFFDNKGLGLEYLNKKATLSLPQNILNTLQEDSECRPSTQMPFFMGIYKQELLDIGGYDEDLTGYAWDDNDLMERLKSAREKHSALTYYFTFAKTIHLYHGERSGCFSYEGITEWEYNKDIVTKKKGTVKRNEGKEWGKL